MPSRPSLRLVTSMLEMQRQEADMFLSLYCLLLSRDLPTCKDSLLLIFRINSSMTHAHVILMCGFVYVCMLKYKQKSPNWFYKSTSET